MLQTARKMQLQTLRLPQRLLPNEQAVSFQTGLGCSPYQSSSTRHYSVCMILISSNMVNVRQNKFYSGLHQHHIR